MTPADPGRVLRRALLAWGLGHLAVGRHATGRLLLVAEAVSLLVVMWLTLGLAASSAYLVPFLAGTAFIAAWAWQAVDAYRSARVMAGAGDTAPERSPAAAIGWLTVPLLLWGTGFWLVAADGATPAAALDRLVAAWEAGTLDAGDWPAGVATSAAEADTALDDGPNRLRDVRVRLVREEPHRATAAAEAIHHERRDSRFLWVFESTELVPVADELLLTIYLVADPVELTGGGDIDAVRWRVADVDSGR